MANPTGTRSAAPAAAVLATGRFLNLAQDNYAAAGADAAGAIIVGAEAIGDFCTYCHDEIVTMDIADSSTVSVGDEIASGANGVAILAVATDWVLGHVAEIVDSTTIRVKQGYHYIKA